MPITRIYITIIVDHVSELEEFTLHIRSMIAEVDAQTPILVVKPAAPAIGMLFTWESGCRLGCTSVILK